ncbi:SecY translocase [Candidatus Hepatoplasma crinochetorum Av]|uniref:Protein translocase subunit SecY n=1 Tax=Candidatus Hepatoplasma crinochetorum Av TaxID=1427984 RepID=W8GF99_9MOLU|nr:preprotein translocase subunit SecY [Candidatus Hepatoplasma crinochetorum]AHK22434.1 SecY translocase [Candidatus Hepatoplasma crinochetorum Av]
MIREIFTNWKILKRILITLIFILLFRLGTLITIPGVTVTNNDFAGDTNSQFLSLLNIIGGGGLLTFSIFALGVTPYITASIIIQLLSADVIPYLTRLNKQGEKGRIKIEKITRIVTIFIAIIQGFAIVFAMNSAGYIEQGTLFESEWAMILFAVLIMVTGSMISIWIADEITMRGVGNGTSLLIATGIVARIPYKFENIWGLFINDDSFVFTGFILFLFYLAVAILFVFLLSFFEISERRIPIQQTGKGLNLEEDKQTYLPLKINPAGVVPVIFASAIITLPPTIAQFFPDSAFKEWVIINFSLTSALGLTLYGLLIIAFTYFYAQININPEETAKNFQKSSTFIVGIKPGKETEKYLVRTVNSVSTYGAFLLAFIATLPFILTFFGISQSAALGGTGLIILVSVGIDTTDQIKSRILAEQTKTHAKVTANLDKSYKINKDVDNKKRNKKEQEDDWLL